MAGKQKLFPDVEETHVYKRELVSGPPGFNGKKKIKKMKCERYFVFSSPSVSSFSLSFPTTHESSSIEECSTIHPLGIV